MSDRLLSVSLFILFCLVTAFITNPRMPPTGDEPHYLIAAHSLAIDADLSLRENYIKRDYRIFYPGLLSKRTTFNPDRTKELPAFSPGLSFVLTPFYWLSFQFFPSHLVLFLRFLMCALAAFALHQVILFSRDLAGSYQGGLPVIAAFALASPVLTYCNLFYPELLGFVLVVVALRQIHTLENKPWKSAILLAIISSALIWVHPKYIALSTLIFLISIRRLSIAARNHELGLTGPRLIHIALSVAGIFSFFFFLNSEYGSWSPNRIYGGAQKETDLFALLTKEGIQRIWTMLRMIPGYFLDQRFGILIYTPAYVAFFPAVIWSTHKEGTKLTSLLILFFAHFLLLSWGAQMGGYAPPSRHFVVMVPFLILPILITYADWSRIQKRIFLALSGVGWVVALLVLIHYRLVYTNATWRNPDGYSEFWQHFHFDRLIPRLTSSPPDYLPLALWLALVIGFSFLLYPRSKEKLNHGIH